MNRITSAFSGVVGGTTSHATTTSDRTDTTSIHTSSHDEHSASSYSHEHTHGHGQYRRHDYPYQNAGSVAPSPTECDFPLHAEHAPAHAQGQVQVQGRRTGQAGEGYHLDNSAGGGGGGLEYVFDDPRRPYYCQQLAPSPVRPSSWHYSTISGAGDIGDRAGSIAGTGSISGSHSGSNAAADGRKSMQAQSQQRTNNLAPGSSGISTSSGFSKTASFGSSSLASNTSFLYQDADYALPFSHAHVQHGSAQHYSKAQSFGSFASSTGGGGGAEAAHSDASDASKYPWSSYPPYGAGVHGGRPSTNTAGPDRYVRTVLTYASYQPAGSRRGNRATAGSGGSIGSVQPDRPLSFKSMAKGPEGSNRVVLAANDALRIVAITSATTASSSTTSSTTSRPTSSSPLAQDEKTSSSSSSTRSATLSGKPGFISSNGGARAIAHGPGGARIEEVVNLWKGVPQGSVARVVNSVDWGVGAMGNKVLTACSNGNFMVFDVERNRFEREVSAGHSRAMLCLAMSKTPSQGHRVLTAGADGYAKLWDLRQPQNPALMSVRHPSPIVSLAFSPPGIDAASAQNSYILGLENGSIFRYEWRMAARSVGRITAAHGAKAVMALEWKECGVGDKEAAGGQGVGSGGWLASGGLDRTVKIWDMTAVEMPTYPYHTIFTPHPVRRIAWRPGHDTELAVVSIPTTTTFGTSCKTMQESQNNEEGTAAEQMDESRLEVWDVRRGHVAKYILGKASRFGETGAVTDLIWPDGYAVQTCYSNGAIVQHDIRSHIRPLDHMPRQAVAWSPQGEATFSLDRWVVGEIPFDDIKPEFAEQALLFARKAISDPPFSTRQVTLTFPPDQLADDKFHYLAYAYKLEPGENTADTCDWNAQAASEVDEHEHERLWLLVKQLFQRQQEHPVPNVDGRVGPIAPLSDTASGDRISAATFDSAPPDASRLAADNNSQDDKNSIGKEEEDSRSEESSIKPKQPQQAVTMADLRSSNNTKRRASSSGSSSGSDSPPYDDISRTPMPGRLQLGSLTPSIQDSHLSDTSAFRFGGASSAKTPGNTSMKSPLFNALSRLPHTGVSEGDDDAASLNGATRPSRPPGPHVRSSFYHVREDTTRSETASTVKVSPSIPPTASRRPSDMASLPTAAITVYQSAEERHREEQRLKVLRDWRVFHVSILRKAYTTVVEQGEVQTACAIYLVAGHVLGLSDQEGQMLVETYLEQLDRRRLSGVAAAIRRDYRGTRSQTLAETVIQSRCGKCRKSVEFEGKPAPWFCDSCKSALVACVVCHLPVKGLYTGCSKCAHGGHETCMRDVEVRYQPRYHYNDTAQLPRSHSPSPFNNWRQMATPGKRYSSPTSGPDVGCTRSPSRGPLSSAGDATMDHDDPLEVTSLSMTWDANPRSCVTGCGCACNGPR